MESRRDMGSDGKNMQEGRSGVENYNRVKAKRLDWGKNLGSKGKMKKCGAKIKIKKVKRKTLPGVKRLRRLTPGN
ncbi:MAG: hypothetical protein LBT59_29145 [Clostridiales bacterium]|nr:hypothetical protein [Clostridiales bacterium]